MYANNDLLVLSCVSTDVYMSGTNVCGDIVYMEVFIVYSSLSRWKAYICCSTCDTCTYVLLVDRIYIHTHTYSMPTLEVHTVAYTLTHTHIHVHVHQGGALHMRLLPPVIGVKVRSSSQGEILKLVKRSS